MALEVGRCSYLMRKQDEKKNRDKYATVGVDLTFNIKIPENQKH